MLQTVRFQFKFGMTLLLLYILLMCSKEIDNVSFRTVSAHTPTTLKKHKQITWMQDDINMSLAEGMQVMRTHLNPVCWLKQLFNIKEEYTFICLLPRFRWEDWYSPSQWEWHQSSILTLSKKATRVFPETSNYCFKVIERSSSNSTSHLKQPLYLRLICKDLCQVWCKKKRRKLNTTLEWKALTWNLRPQYISDKVFVVSSNSVWHLLWTSSFEAYWDL